MLDGTVVKRAVETCSSDECSCSPIPEIKTFKTIPSYILHTSPTDAEFGAQTQSLYTPSLPIDTDRYIDFIGAK